VSHRAAAIATGCDCTAGTAGLRADRQHLADSDSLGQIDNNSYDQSDAEAEVFGGLASAQRKRQSLVANETSRFGGTSGAGAQTFGKQSPGYGDY
jgi:hypothetical protein